MMKKFAFGLVFILTTFLFLPISLYAQSGLPTNASKQQMNDFTNMLQHIMPAVVNISATGTVDSSKSSSTNPMLPQQAPSAGDGQTMEKFQSLGSGVIVNADKGYILTNAHVVSNAQLIYVTLSDGRQLKAKVIGADAASDIAVLQIHAKDLTAIQFGNSSDLKVGSFVAAIGNPFGLTQTVTSGIVSALSRSDLHIEGYEDFIQTDAPINPGNSGGALVNLDGQLVGINTAILSSSGGNIGIGFAIPSDMAHGVMLQLIKYGKVRRGLIGVYAQDINPALADALGLNTTHGAIIAQVTPYSPAAKANIQPYDVILQVNHKKINNAAQLRNTVGFLPIGTKVHLKILHNGKDENVSLEIANPKKYLAHTAAQSPYLFGVTVKDFDLSTPAHGYVHGVLVLNVTQSSEAWRDQLRPGDIIVSANKTPVKNFEQLKSIAAQSKHYLLLNVLRGKGALFIVLKKQTDE